MKKLFFFRSNSSNNGNDNQISPPSMDKQVYWEKQKERKGNCKQYNHGSDDRASDNAPCLRRSLSFSSGSLYDTGEMPRNMDLTGSPCSASYYSNKQSGKRSSRSRTLTPERLTRSKCDASAVVRNAHRVDKHACKVPSANSDLSEISSYCSSNVSNNVLDRYIDGEQIERCGAKTTKNQFENGVVKRPPRFQLSAPVSCDGRKQIQNPKSQSFREAKTSKVQVPSKDTCNDEYCNESPRKVARQVVERLSQSRMRSRDFDSDNPITVEDVYGRALNKSSDNVYGDEVFPNHCTMDWYTDTSSNRDEFSEFVEKESSGALTEADVELYKNFKLAEDRAAVLADEIGKGDLIQFRGLTLQTLIQTIRSLTKDKANMAQEVLSVLEDRIAERALFREKVKQERVETDALSRRLEKEKSEIQLTLEKELDRRSTEWSVKLEKLKAEEQRLRERVRELAEQNVCLQREVSSFSDREMESRVKITNSDKQLGDLSNQVEKVTEENDYLQRTLSELIEKTRAAEEDRDCVRRKYEEKVTECKDMHQAISRLQRTCNEQEKTVDGLRGLCEELGRKISKETFDFGIAKLQIEHVRLTGVEHALRKEVELCRVEIDSLRSENIELLNRLKNNGKEGEFSTLKLDRELQSRISWLQKQMLPFLTESSQLSRKLIEYVKTGCFPPKNGPPSLSAQVLVECEVKIQGLERAAENLATTMNTMSVILEKSKLLHEKSSHDNELQKCGEQKSEGMVRSAFEAETLLTGLLRDKLYLRELDVEQLQAELAAAVRGNDILKSEVQNAVDNFSCVNHKLKELELQMMKKDETINQLQSDLQDCRKELAIVRGILPKVTEERDLMWEEIKRHTENNMLLNSEINVLRKKTEALDEEILLKEGQITILKDTISKPFDLIASPDSADNLFWTEKR